MNCNWSGKIKVTLVFVSISWKKECWHNFKATSEEVIAIHSEKMKAKYIKKTYERVFFVTLQAGISQLHYELFSSKIIFRGFDWMTPSNDYFSLDDYLNKTLEK